MIIETPIDLELTQMSGQTSQPPWSEVDGTFSNVVDVNDNPVIFNVRQCGEFLDFNYAGDVSDRQAIDKLNYIFDLDFDLDSELDLLHWLELEKRSEVENQGHHHSVLEVAH